MIYLIYGNQSSAIKSRVKKICKEKLSERDEMNYVKFDASNTLIQEIIDEANYIPLGYDFKVVVAEDCYFLQKSKARNKIEKDQDYEKLEKYLNNPNDMCDLILTVNTIELDKNSSIFKAISAKCSLVEIKEPSIKDWESYVRNYIDKVISENPNYSMDRDAVQELSDRTQADIPLLKNSIEKLFLYKNSISYEDVALLVSRPLEENSFLLFNYLIDGKNQEAIGLFRDLKISNAEPVTLISMLSNQFRLLMQICYLSKENNSADQIASQLKINPYRAQILKRQAYSFTEEKILEVLDDLYNLDCDIKSGLIQDRFYAFEMFLINYKRN